MRAFVGLGSNLGDRLANLQSAVDRLTATPGIAVVRSSRIYETAPVGPPQPDYLNAVVEVSSRLSPRILLAACASVERGLGRVRTERWGPRTIDLDLLVYGDEEIDEPDLQVPHPRMHERAFVLIPLLELEADPRLPGGRRAGDLRLGSEALAGVRPFPASLRVPVPRTVLSPVAIALIGAGRVATSLGVLWRRAGHRVVAAAGRDASRERLARHLPDVPLLPSHQAAAGAEVVVIGVPDDLIRPVCEQVAPHLGRERHVIHLSGSVGLDALAAARDAGAGTLSLHPFQSFPDVETGLERLPGSGIAVTAGSERERLFGEALARDAGGSPFRLDDRDKPLYHAAAVFASNYLVTIEALAERLLGQAGVAGALGLIGPLARTALDRTLGVGPSVALTGPAVRGDTGTIERNLSALAERAPDALEAYAALAAVAARLAESGGRLDATGRRAVEEAVERWR